MLLMILLIAFIVIPLVEIALFIEIGGWIGLWPTIATVVGTALLGSFALRAQGTALFRQLQTGHLTTLPDLVSNGLLLLISGVCLITPGFLTDAVGLGLLLPPVRYMISRLIVKNAVAFVATSASRPDWTGAQRAEDERAQGKAGAYAAGYGEGHAGDRRTADAQGDVRHAPSRPASTKRSGRSPWSEAPPNRKDDIEDAHIIDDDPPRQ